MTKITILEFCPQCETDTQEAITEAKNIIKNGGDVELRPNQIYFTRTASAGLRLGAFCITDQKILL